MVKIVTHDVNFSNHCTGYKGQCDQVVQDCYKFVPISHGVYNFNTSQNKIYEKIEKKNCLAKVRRRLTPSAQYRMAESACHHFFPISEFSYKLIRFLLNSYVVKSDNEISKFFRYGMSQTDLAMPQFMENCGKKSGSVVNFLQDPTNILKLQVGECHGGGLPKYFQTVYKREI